MEESKIIDLKTLPTYIGEIIEDGFYDKLIIIGFPYDEGAKTIGARGGSDYGPDSFRRFVKKIGVLRNPEYDIDITKSLPQISDYGNIQISSQPGQPKASIKDLLDKLSVKVSACIKRGNIPFVIGGSRDLFGAVSDALQHAKPEARNAYISINHTMDLDFAVSNKVISKTPQHNENSQRDQRNLSFDESHGKDLTGLKEDQQIDQNKNQAALSDINIFKEYQLIPHQTTNKRYLLEKMHPKKNVLFEFGTSGLSVDMSQVQYFKEKNADGQIIWMNEIRKTQLGFDHTTQQCTTQGGLRFMQLLNKINQDQAFDQIYISFNLECVEAAVGVTTNQIAGGFTSEEAVEICLLAGLNSEKVAAIDICEYNPFVEDWRTGRLVATMFYYFALGLSIRLSKQ